jgi:glucose/arabinose dehydrogenase
MLVHPATGDLYCSVNERDELGDNLPPDYVTRVKQGGFYGWPWYYIGANEDPRLKGIRPDLKDKVIVPDTLIQAHSAPLGMVVYQAPKPARRTPSRKSTRATSSWPCTAPGTAASAPATRSCA